MKYLKYSVPAAALLVLLFLAWPLAGFAVTGTWLLFVFYAACMSLKRARDEGKMPPGMYSVAALTLLVGLLLDAFVNVFVCTLIFAELPREWLVTQRLTRHATGDGWRSLLARWVCSNLLDALDPTGCHCK